MSKRYDIERGRWGTAPAGSGEEVTETISSSSSPSLLMLPAWLLGGNRPVDRERWLDAWRESKARPETLAMAHSMTATGFDWKTGKQRRAKAASIIAADAGKSQSAAERFLNKARQQGRLTPTGEAVTLVPGKQATPLYQLTLPGERAGLPFSETVPDAVRPELEAAVELSHRLAALAESPAPWSEYRGTAPEWATPVPLAAAA